MERPLDRMLAWGFDPRISHLIPEPPIGWTELIGEPDDEDRGWFRRHEGGGSQPRP